MRRGSQAVAAVEALYADIAARIEPTRRDSAREAARLRAEHGPALRVPDALVVASARVLHAQHLLTTDRGWPRGLPVAVEII